MLDASHVCTVRGGLTAQTSDECILHISTNAAFQYGYVRAYGVTRPIVNHKKRSKSNAIGIKRYAQYELFQLFRFMECVCLCLRDSITIENNVKLLKKTRFRHFLRGSQSSCYSIHFRNEEARRKLKQSPRLNSTYDSTSEVRRY